MSILDSETVIVTGASRGLGASMAKRFADEGANVVLTARNKSDLEHVADQITSKTLIMPADVTNESEVRSVVDSTVNEFGVVTGLVNNAGIGMLTLHNDRQVLHEIDVHDFRQIMDVNVTGVFLYSKSVVPELIDTGRGNIINISSGAGRHGRAKWGPYGVSKWAVEGLTRIQADELDTLGINVNGLDPGGRVDTGFWDHLAEAERAKILDPDVMNDAATSLLAQGRGGVTGESMSANEWEQRLGS